MVLDRAELGHAEILSIDIADVDVGRNISARLQMDQAETDKNIAQAKAAKDVLPPKPVSRDARRYPEMRAQVVQAETKVPGRLRMP